MSTYPKSHWQEKINSYSESQWVDQPMPFARLVAQKLDKGSKILELGTGAGQDALWFASQDFQVTATDAQDTFFDQIKTKAELHGLDITLALQDVLEAFSFEDGAFDVVYAHLVLHYFTDSEMKQILSEILRVLKPGGMIADVFNSQDDPEYDESIAQDGIIEGKIVKRYFTVDMVENIFSDFDTIMLDKKVRP